MVVPIRRHCGDPEPDECLCYLERESEWPVEDYCALVEKYRALTGDLNRTVVERET